MMYGGIGEALAWRVPAWSGLDGSIAAALSLPASRQRDIVVGLTCMAVAPSILEQGFGIDKVVRPSMPGSMRSS